MKENKPKLNQKENIQTDSNGSIYEFGVTILFHAFVIILGYLCIQGYNHFFPKSTEEVEQQKDPKRKKYFESYYETKYHPQLNEKISKLDTISQSLSEIQYFIDYQKKTLEIQNKNLQAIIDENRELAPIVSSNSKL